MRISVPLVALISSLGITAFALAADDPLMKQAQGLFQPIPLEPVAVKGVTSTPAMVELGTDLYFDPRLSQSHNISCNTCHQIGLGGVKLFEAAYPNDKDPITMPNAVTAIAAFEATLITPNSPFDKFLRGDANALSAEQKEGLKLFIDTGCASCHSGINVGGQMYAPFGVVQKPGADILPPNDKGRFAVTKTASDEYVFRVPPLRNVELTVPYFHSGQVWDLTQAVGIMATDQLGKTLTDAEVAKIVAFLKSLTGDQPQVTYPILPPSVASTPRPQP